MPWLPRLGVSPRPPRCVPRAGGARMDPPGCRAPHPPCHRVEGDAPGGKPGVAFPFQPLQLLVCSPGQETGPLPVVFFFPMSGARDTLPPARKTRQPGPGIREGEGHQSHQRHHSLMPAWSHKPPSPPVLSAGGTAQPGVGGGGNLHLPTQKSLKMMSRTSSAPTWPVMRPRCRRASRSRSAASPRSRRRSRP